MKSITSRFCLAVFSMLIAVGGAAAQPAPKSERLLVTIIDVHPQMVREYETFVRTQTNPALLKGGVKWRDAWKTTLGESFQYVYVQPMDDFAVMDGPSTIEKALGKDGAAAWNASASKFTRHVKRMVVMTRPDLSYNSPTAGRPNVAVVTHAVIAWGRNADFEKWLKNDMLPVVSRSGVSGYWVSQVGLGGNANEYIVLVPHANYAELEKGPPSMRVLGREEHDKLHARLPAGTAVSVERHVVRMSPELSFSTMPTAKK